MVKTLDYGYSAHRRTVEAVSGKTVQGKADFVHVGTPVTILENRVNGRLRSVTVLGHNGRALARLSGETARY